MNDEERAKYVCSKDKENLEKAIKKGHSFTYLSQYTEKSIWQMIGILGIYISIIFGGMLIMEDNYYEKNQHDKNLLVKQVDDYIKADYKNMNCVEKNVFLEKYISDASIYGHIEMSQWLKDNFNDNCVQPQK